MSAWWRLVAFLFSHGWPFSAPGIRSDAGSWHSCGPERLEGHLMRFNGLLAFLAVFSPSFGPSFAASPQSIRFTAYQYISSLPFMLLVSLQLSVSIMKAPEAMRKA